MSFLKGLLKYAPAALTLAAPFFPPLAAAGPLAGLTGGGLGAAAGAAAKAAPMFAGAAMGSPPPGAPPPDLPPPITSEAGASIDAPPPRPVLGAVTGPPQGHGGSDLGNFDYRSLLAGARPGARTGSVLPGLLGGLAGHALKKLF